MLSHKALADRAVQFASRSYILSTGEIRPALRYDRVVAVPSTAMPLLLNAAESLPSQTRITNPLIDTGFLYFEEAWPRPDRGSEWQALFYSYRVLNEDGTPTVFGLTDSVSGIGLMTNLPEDDLRYRAVAAFNLLAEQEVVVTTVERPSRQIRRNAGRSGRPSDVTIIQLPHRVYSPGGDGTNQNRYSHQWLVTGHWRQQPYPSRQETRPLWISPYVKGPEGKPLVIKERRYVFNPPKQIPEE